MHTSGFRSIPLRGPRVIVDLWVAGARLARPVKPEPLELQGLLGRRVIPGQRDHPALQVRRATRGTPELLARLAHQAQRDRRDLRARQARRGRQVLPARRDSGTL